MLTAILAAAAIQADIKTDPLVADLQHRAFEFFWKESHPETGLTKDRARNNGQKDEYNVASIASTGFALVAYPIGVERKWVERKQAYDRTVLTLNSINDLVEQEHGWLYHFIDWKSGKRVWNCEASTIDTAILLAGVVAAERYWKDAKVTQLAEKFWKRIDWQWAISDGGKKPHEALIVHGWKPEEGFLNGRWSAGYSEEKMLYILGCGLSNIRSDGWVRIGRKFENYGGIEFITGGPLFIHQMSEGFFDFSEKRDGMGINIWVASKNAALANRQYCIDNPKKFKGYGPNFWGLSACDTPSGYKALGAPGWTDDDGTITPTSVLAASPYLPTEAVAFAHHMREAHPTAWGKYGFPNGYNPNANWVDPDVIGIDLGMMLLNVENARNGFVHKLTSSSPAMQRGYKRLGFRDVPGSNKGPLVDLGRE